MENEKILHQSILNPLSPIRFGHRGLDHLVGQMAAQRAYVTARYDPKRRVLTAWFAMEPHPLPCSRSRRTSGNPMEAWRPAAALDRYAVNGWLCEMVKRRSPNVPSKIKLDFMIEASLANAVQTALMFDHIDGYSFGSDVDAFLDWAECALHDVCERDGDPVVIISSEADLQGWSWSSGCTVPTVAKPKKAQQKGPALNLLVL